MNSCDAKLSFLQSEIASLKEEKNELKNLLQLNKQIIKIFKDSPTSKILTSKNSVLNQDFQTEQSENNCYQSFHSLIQEMQKEINTLYDINETLSAQRNELRTQVLLLEQIRLENAEKLLEIQNDKQKKLIDLQNQLSLKDNLIVEQSLQLQEFLYKRRLRTKITTGVTEELLVCQNQLEAMNSLLIKFYEENTSCKQQNQQMIIMLDLFNSEKENEFSYDKGDSIIMDNIPQKAIIKKNIQLGVPKLNLGKAKRIQQLTVEKQEDEEKEQRQIEQIAILDKKILSQGKAQTPSQGKNGQFISPNKLLLQLTQLADQNKFMTKELNMCKQKLQNELLLSKALENKLDEVQRYINSLENTNEILIKSHIKTEEILKKLKQFLYEGQKQLPSIKRHKYNISIQLTDYHQETKELKKRSYSDY